MTVAPSQPDLAGLYAQTRERVAELVEDADPRTLAPATPGWTVRDVVTHLAGVASDLTSGRMEGAATPAWTAAQLDARAGNDVAASLGEWQLLAPAIDELCSSGSRLGTIILADAVSHELDIRGALGDEGGRDTEALRVTVDGFMRGLGARIAAQGLPTLRVRAGDGEWIAGEGDPAATVTVPDRFTLLRALTGRRTEAEIRAFDWTAAPDPWLDTFSVFPFAEHSLGE